MQRSRYLTAFLTKKFQIYSREILQRIKIAVRPAMELEENETPQAKRAKLEEGDKQENECGASDSATPVVKVGGPRFAKRRKCILLMAYNGKGYMGMQKNPGVLTIEEDLLEALAKAGAFPEEMKDNLGKLQFQRCARTDKGVSAARQVVSIKMVPDQDIVPRMNSFLPDKIRVIALKRVTKSFDSRHGCSARTYEYLLPTYAFAPFRLTTLDYRIDDQTIAKVNGLLGQYVGTHNFHNFTSGTKFEQMASNRFIMSFECGRPFLASAKCSTCRENKEAEFMTLKVKGQSFMIHQIRKMIGLVIAIVRGRTAEETLQKAYEKEKVDIPRAPGLGLLLDNVHFERYNVRISGDGLHEPLDWTPYEEEIEKFKRENIHQSIIDTEIDEMSMSQWLGSLQIHDFNQTATRLKQQQQQPLQCSSTDNGEKTAQSTSTLDAVKKSNMTEASEEKGQTVAVGIQSDVNNTQGPPGESTSAVIGQTVIECELKGDGGEGEVGEMEQELVDSSVRCSGSNEVSLTDAKTCAEQATGVVWSEMKCLPTDSVVSEESAADKVDRNDQTDNNSHQQCGKS